MKAVLSTTGRALRRRGAGINRTTTLTMRRDPFAAEPGPVKTLYLGERTEYRPAAYLLDRFQRENGALGEGYGPWTSPSAFDDLAIVNQKVTAAALVGPDSFVVHSSVLPRDQYAEATLASLSVTVGAEALIGVGLRMSPVDGDGHGYLAQVVRSFSGTMATQLVRYDAGVESVLDGTTAFWMVGDVLRFTAEWNRMRVYQNGVLILEYVDPSPLIATFRAAIQAKKLSASDAASLTHFVAGPLRQEYAGHIINVGSVGASLGLVEPTATPAAWDVSLINCSPIGGADRFASLIRHGENDGYEIERAEVRLLTAVQDGSAPVSGAHGLVEQLTDMSVMSCRLMIRGRDGFIEPKIEQGDVAYLPGSDPIISSAPLPEDPCGDDAVPIVTPGPLPAEPPSDPPTEGTGPESPPAPADGAGVKRYRVTYLVHDVNSHTLSAQAESANPVPTGIGTHNFINPANRPLHADDVSAGLVTHHIWIFRSVVIGPWLGAHSFSLGKRIRRSETDPIVFECSIAGTTGAGPPAWNTTKGSYTTDGTVTWYCWGDCSPIVDAVPGSHLRLQIGVLASFDNPVKVAVGKRYGGGGGPDSGAPPDLDDTLAPDYSILLPSTQTIHTFTTGGSFTIDIEVGDATAITIRPEAGFEASASADVQLASFFTPAPP